MESLEGDERILPVQVKVEQQSKYPKNSYFPFFTANTQLSNERIIAKNFALM